MAPMLSCVRAENLVLPGILMSRGASFRCACKSCQESCCRGGDGGGAHEHLLERAASLPITFESLDKDCLANVLLFVRPCCMRRAACVSKRLRSAVLDERAWRVKVFPWREHASKGQRMSVNGSPGCNMLSCAPDGSCLIGAGSADSSLEATVYAAGLNVMGVLRGYSTRVFSVATDGKHHATGHMNGNIQIWDAATLALAGEPQHGRSPVLGLAVRADVLVSGSTDSTAKCWSIAECECRATLQHKLKKSVNSVSVDGVVVATASDDGTARLWAHGSATCKHVLQHAAEVNAVSLAGEVVATGCYDNLVRLFGVDNGRLMRMLRGHGCEVLSVHATDGVIVSGARDHTVRVWLMEEEAVAVLEGHSDSVQGVVLAPGGGLVTSLSSSEILTWRAPNMAPAWLVCGCHGVCQCPSEECSVAGSA